MEQKDKDAIKSDIALFRYGLIAPIITGTFNETSKTEFLRNVASKTYIVNGKEQKFAPETIRDWVHKYQEGGFNALIPKTRNDCNSSRKLNLEVQEQIKALKKDYPHISGTLIYNKLIDDVL